MNNNWSLRVWDQPLQKQMFCVMQQDNDPKNSKIHTPTISISECFGGKTSKAFKQKAF